MPAEPAATVVEIKEATFMERLPRGCGPFVHVRLLVSAADTDFEVLVPVSRDFDDGEVVAVARHKLHLYFTSLAEQTAHWRLSPELLGWREVDLPKPAKTQDPLA